MITADHLFQKIRSGDEAAFESLFRTLYPVLCNFAGRFFSDPAVAEEAVQEVMVRFWEKRETIQLNSSIKSYLFGAVHKHCLNLIKHEQVKSRYAQEIQAQGNGFVEPEEPSGLQEKITDSIQRLPEERRKVFLLSREEGLKYREIAEKLNISVKTVENQMGKALQFLRKELQEFMVWIGIGLYLLLKNFW